jgi:transglutaminase-like putative cysteine protease
VRSCRVDVTPATWIDEYKDYWGTKVTAFEVLAPHKRLRIVSDTVVDVKPPDVIYSVSSHGEVTALGLAGSPISWVDLESDDVLDAYAAYLTQTPTTEPPEEVVQLAEYVMSGIEGEITPIAAAPAICLAIRDNLEYVPGVTTVHTPAAEAWAHRRGVCQDMAHLCIGALRAVGIPARYVSGYLHPKPDAAIGETVSGESHAWLEFWTGEWVGYDPTNRKFVGTDHVLVARGREYGDVPPLKGVFAGASESELKATVEITRLA